MQPLRRARRELRMNGGPAPSCRTPDLVHGGIEREHWRTHYTHCDYVEPGYGFPDYEPAFRYGWELRAGYGACDWEAVEDELAQGWERFRGDSRLTWDEAAPAVRDAFERAGEEPARAVA